MADEFIKSALANGAQIVAHEYTNDKAYDFTAVLTAVKGKQPDLLFYAGMDPQAGPDGEADQRPRAETEVHDG